MTAVVSIMVVSVALMASSTTASSSYTVPASTTTMIVMVSLSAADTMGEKVAMMILTTRERAALVSLGVDKRGTCWCCSLVRILFACSMLKKKEKIRVSVLF